jgi:hypothetical protein
VGVSGTDYGDLKRALKAGNYLNACSAARSLPHVPLADALDLTLLAAEKKPERYEAMARKWLVRWIEETEPPAVEIPVAIACLAARTRPPLRAVR